MPHRRVVKKGSFGGHFDELFKVIVAESRHEAGKAGRRPKPRPEGDNIHDWLFERAREAAQGERKTSR
jgi:hypothetical protein